MPPLPYSCIKKTISQPVRKYMQRVLCAQICNLRENRVHAATVVQLIQLQGQTVTNSLTTSTADITCSHETGAYLVIVRLLVIPRLVILLLLLVLHVLPLLLLLWLLLLP